MNKLEMQEYQKQYWIVKKNKISLFQKVKTRVKTILNKKEYSVFRRIRGIKGRNIIEKFVFTKGDYKHIEECNINI